MIADRLLDVDAALVRRSRALPHAAVADRALAASSRATDHAAGWVVAGLAAAALDRGRARAWLAATAAVVATERTSVVVKRRVGRSRPELPGLPPLATTPSPLSMPSSHTATAVAAARTFGKLTPAPPLWIFAAVTAASRPYLGVHYPSDVLAGALLGELVGRVGRRAVTCVDGAPGDPR